MLASSRVRPPNGIRRKGVRERARHAGADRTVCWTRRRPSSVACGMRKPERSVSKTYGHFVEFAAREILSTGCERHPTRSSLQVLGYSSKGAPQSANKLRKRSDVRGRVDEIRQAAANSTAAEVAFDQQRVLNLLDVLSHKAEDLGQISVAVRGMFIDRQVAEVERTVNRRSAQNETSQAGRAGEGSCRWLRS